MVEQQIINDAVFWIVGFFNILTYVLAGNRSSATWYIGSGTQAAWIVWQMATGHTTFFFISLALLAVNLINLYKWRVANR